MRAAGKNARVPGWPHLFDHDGSHLAWIIYQAHRRNRLDDAGLDGSGPG